MDLSFLPLLNLANLNLKWLVLVLIFTVVLLLVIYILNLTNNDSRAIKNKVYQLNKKNKKNFLVKISTDLGNSLFLRNPDQENLSVDLKRLLNAGYNSKISLPIFYGFKIVLIFLFVFIVLLASSVLSVVKDNLLMFMVVALSLGYIFPSFYLDSKIAKRQKAIRMGFPDIIDQLVVCSEAGLSFEAGLQRIVVDAEVNNEIMAYELGIVIAELRTGLDIEKAFKHLLDRTGVEDIKGFSSAVTQSIRFGTSISETLRLYSEDMRDKHLQWAEEQAAKLAVKMMLPLALCFFPGIFIVILGPAVISIMQNMG